MRIVEVRCGVTGYVIYLHGVLAVEIYKALHGV